MKSCPIYDIHDFATYTVHTSCLGSSATWWPEQPTCAVIEFGEEVNLLHFLIVQL